LLGSLVISIRITGCIAVKNASLDDEQGSYVWPPRAAQPDMPLVEDVRDGQRQYLVGASGA
jgi:hypothetical protein